MRLAHCSDSLSLQLRTLLKSLTSPHIITRRLIFQEAHRHVLHASIACRHAVSGLFHSPPGVLFTFPSRYCFTIGHSTYLALDRGRPRFGRNFTCSALLGIQSRDAILSPTGLSPSTTLFPNQLQLILHFVTLRVAATFPNCPSTRHPQRLQAWHGMSFRLGPLSLTTTYGISYDFFSFGY